MWPFKTHEEKLLKKAKNLPTLFLGIAFTITPKFLSALHKKNLSDEQATALCMEILAFTLHIADRVLFSTFGASDRCIMIDHVLVIVESELYKEGLPSVIDLYNDRSNYYGKLNLTSNNNESPAGTLLFEFAKLISSQYGKNRSLMELTELSVAGSELFDLVTDGLVLEKIL